MATVDRSATRVQGFASGEMDFQLMRMLGACTAGGGTPGEIMAARAKIAGDDANQWPAAFAACAADLMSKAEAALTRNRTVTAREHLLRASSYYRSAEYFSDPFKPDAQTFGTASQSAFVRACEHLPCRAEAVEIPFAGTTLPGYLFQPEGVTGPNKTVLALTGFDGTGEELYFQTAADALTRGFTVLAAQGPGQVSTMRTHPELTFRPDYEVPIAAMIDFVLGLREVDPARLALYGISFGGYFALRGAIHDTRIKALIANSPIVDLSAYMAAFTAGAGAEDVRLDEVDQIPDEYMPPAVKLSFKAACRRFGVTSFSAWRSALESYRAEGLSKITCPSLGLAGQGEGSETLRQLEVFASGVSGPVTTRIFEIQEGADMHCQVGNLPLSNAVIYDWLDEVFSSA
jgi:pimeloyl-ACP methyl ester carboxylesterase